ncbi:MAG: hypothetical protein HFACDABA_00612 [Anaerolineales bacterium]|nr:hypothetical protein [Anaerolineales bacterium]
MALLNFAKKSLNTKYTKVHKGKKEPWRFGLSFVAFVPFVFQKVFPHCGRTPQPKEKSNGYCKT